MNIHFLIEPGQKEDIARGDGSMSESIQHDMGEIKEDNYDKAKINYEVLKSYDIPDWYKKHVWVWPIAVLWIFVVVYSAPEARLTSALAWGGIIVAVDTAMILVRRTWPL
jgi:hypothetical protein